MLVGRRGFLGVLAGLVAAPVVVRSGLLMPVRLLLLDLNEANLGIVVDGILQLNAIPFLLRPGLDAIVGTLDYSSAWHNIFAEQTA